ncbi:DUF4470 domain-containing protein [Microdochium nivale]|nr:DUF4470 domain-containing protein [Microdochium nivale]
MLSVATLNRVNFFYPIGNTPAVALTQLVPANQRATVLSLGCGDVRHILFTAFIDPRPLDVTCCDVQPAIIARNILLLSLLYDGKHEKSFNDVWDVYYHFKITNRPLSLLRDRAQRLFSLSESLQSWRLGAYGKVMDFCDEGTLRNVRAVWAFYAKPDTAVLKQYIDKSLTFRNARDLNRNITGLRSAEPVVVGADIVVDLPEIHESYWEHGTTATEQQAIKAANKFNPAFATLDGDTVLHYGCDPMLGFHLATIAAQATGSSTSLYLGNRNQNKRREVLVAAAKSEFRQWANSFKSNASDITIRFFTGDALAFATLLQKQDSRTTAAMQMYRNQFQFDPVVLDETMYGCNATAPRKFHVIDTSNLADHTGALNIFSAVCPLLNDEPSATLYIETLLNSNQDQDDSLQSLLCGHLQTISLLINLVPLEVVTSTSSISATERSLNELIGAQTGQLVTQQEFVRLAWKRPLRQSSFATFDGPASKTCWNPKDLSWALHTVYLRMFGTGHGLGRVPASLEALARLSLSNYQPASFVAFLKLVKTNVQVDWRETMEYWTGFAERDDPRSTRTLFLQEVCVYLHVLGIHSVKMMHMQPYLRGLPSTRGVRLWKDIPAVVAITLQVPRNKLRFFTDTNIAMAGTPPVECTLTNMAPLQTRWANHFAALQIGFGKIMTRGSRHSDEYEIDITTDPTGWSGNSPLLVTFYAPTWQLLQEDYRGVQVTFRLSTTPQMMMCYAQKLGFELSVFQANIEDEKNVFLTKNLPLLTPAVSARTTEPAWFTSDKAPRASAKEGRARYTITAIAENFSPHVTGLVARVEYLDTALRQLFLDDCRFSIQSLTPFNYNIFLAGTSSEYLVDFPYPVHQKNIKIRHDRNLDYFEVIADVSSSLRAPAAFTYPVLQLEHQILWNMPRVNLAKQPILHNFQQPGVSWLISHLAMAISPKDWPLLEYLSTPLPDHEHALHNTKVTLTKMFTNFKGLEGCEPASFFEVDCNETEGIDMLIFVSELKLDLSSRTIVLDAAVISLEHEMTEVEWNCLEPDNLDRCCRLEVSRDELQLLKTFLPAWAERCRDGWQHNPAGCEFRTTRFRKHLTKVFCSCGEGRFPHNYKTALSSSAWKKVAKYATRVAISPIFYTPLADERAPVTTESTAFENNVARGRYIFATLYDFFVTILFYTFAAVRGAVKLIIATMAKLFRLFAALSAMMCPYPDESTASSKAKKP